MGEWDNIGMFAGKKILVVDDNRDSADMLLLLLEANGATAEAVYNGYMLLEKVKAFNPHIIILDIGMPILNGFQICKTLREAGNKALIIALTGYTQPSDKEKAKEVGFDAYWIKPMDAPELFTCLLTLLEKG